ncbi:MAG: tyrosine-type recombinase/integrase, partial [Candidatus Scalindua sp.]|nr:tyrosine-type recombinase/integrase [Candidatus Scalindua sp.]MCR4343785.1 tyrosine-type recombinase/integrase [Candidatus Scalindua sp.]
IGRNKTFKDMMEKFMKEYSPKVSINMQRSYTTSLKHLSPFFCESNLLSISPKMVSRYKVLRNDECAAPASVNRELSMLSKAFNLAVREWEWLRDNPASKVTKDKENNERDRWLTKYDEKKILGNSPEWLREIIIFNLNTGLRIQELLSLEWSRVNLLRKTIIIQETKNGSPKTLPLNKIALGVLNQRSKVKSIKNDLVFFNSNGKKINPHVLRTSFYSVLRKTGIENLWLHDLRRTFATRLAQAGVDLYKISKLLGHKDIKMTQRYAHHCPDSLRDGVEILEVDYNLTTVGEKECLKSM